jgi:hypothetical protein
MHFSPPRQPLSRAAEGRVYGRAKREKQQPNRGLAAAKPLFRRAAAWSGKHSLTSGCDASLRRVCPVKEPARSRNDYRSAGQLIREGVNGRNGGTSLRLEARMFPRWFYRLCCLALLALISLQSPGFASINAAGVLLSPIVMTPKSCSGAFRYAAREGNTDIVIISPARVFAEDRRLARTRYTSRAMVGIGAERSVLMSSNTMC